METTKITTKKKIGMANPLVQKIGTSKSGTLGTVSCRDIEQLEIEES